MLAALAWLVTTVDGVLIEVLVVERMGAKGPMEEFD